MNTGSDEESTERRDKSSEYHKRVGRWKIIKSGGKSSKSKENESTFLNIKVNLKKSSKNQKQYRGESLDYVLNEVQPFGQNSANYVNESSGEKRYNGASSNEERRFGLISRSSAPLLRTSATSSKFVIFH